MPLGIVSMMEAIAHTTMNKLKPRATMAASRMLTLSWRPTKVITPSSQTILSLLTRKAVKMAAEIATPKAPPSEEAIL